MKKYGFTLIELLAVIIILGVLMLVAIPSVTNYINNSRKEAYIDTAKQFLKGATNLVNSGSLDVYDTDTTYYIPSTCVALESGGDSPYGGKFAPAYILVTYNNDSFNYFWMSTDNQNMGIKIPTSTDKLNIDLIESGVSSNDIKPLIGMDGRKNIVEFDSECEEKNTASEATKLINSVTGEEIIKNYLTLEFVMRQNANSITTGDEVKIGSEYFYIISSDSIETKLLVKQNVDYNINSQVPGGKSISFSNTGYWDKCKADNSIHCTTSSSGLIETYGTGYSAYVYDSNNNMYPYVNAYANKIANIAGVEVTGRLISLSELSTLRNANEYGANAAKGNGGYWTGVVINYASPLWVTGAGTTDFTLFNLTHNNFRPIIIIKTEDIRS